MNSTIKINEIKKGIRCCIENANDLIYEAEVLLNNKIIARTHSLSQLAMEEAGKSMMLYDLYNSLQMGKRVEFDFKTFRKKFRDHKWKTFKTNLIDFMMFAENEKINDLEEFSKTTFEEIKKIKDGHYDNLKNNSLYVSIENDRFLKPSEIFNENEVTDFFLLTKSKIEFLTKWTKSRLEIDENFGADKEGIITLINKDLNK